MVSEIISSQDNEKIRVEKLKMTGLLEAEASETFDQITRLATQVFKMPIALVTLIDSDRQWFKSRIGLDLIQTKRQFSFCSHTIDQREVMVVEDAKADPRFSKNPLVTEHPYIRFYAGAPLILPCGYALGSLCVLDRVPRKFSIAQCEQLETLAKFVVAQIEIQRRAGRVNEITKFPNRVQMNEDIEEIKNEGMGLMLIEVLHHQKLQDAIRALGIAHLEATLKDIAIRLSCIVGPGWPVYHVSEARFCVMTQGATHEAREAFCCDVIAMLEEPFESAGVTVQLEVKAGLVNFTRDSLEKMDALRRATSALHEASARGNKFLWHEPAFDVVHTRAYGLVRDVSAGLFRGEFRLVYQPKFNVAEGRYTGVEALARWSHPLHGDISPAEFIPLVEKTALIHEFTHWVLSAAVSQAAKWIKAGLNVTVAVNVSSLNLDRPGFVQSIVETCKASGIDPNWLHIECTENAVMTSDETRAALTAIRILGCQVSLDDFGMGYSNLACLRYLPVQMIKLDQSLIKVIDSDVAAFELVQFLIQLIQSLGFRVLAEGVETERACRMLLEAGCDALQGYYLSRPMEASDIADFIATTTLDCCVGTVGGATGSFSTGSEVHTPPSE